MNIDECFRILELKTDATAGQLKAARNELLQVWHPDKFASNPKLAQRALEKSQKINLAYETLVVYLESEPQNDSKNQSDKDIYRKEMELAVREQEARMRRIDRRKAIEKRIFRRVKIAFVTTILAVFILAAGKLAYGAILLALIIIAVGVFKFRRA